MIFVSRQPWWLIRHGGGRTKRGRRRLELARSSDGGRQHVKHCYPARKKAGRVEISAPDTQDVVLMILGEGRISVRLIFRTLFVGFSGRYSFDSGRVENFWRLIDSFHD